jgi:hypothetical protein
MGRIGLPARSPQKRGADQPSQKGPTSPPHLCTSGSQKKPRQGARLFRPPPGLPTWRNSQTPVSSPTPLTARLAVGCCVGSRTSHIAGWATCLSDLMVAPAYPGAPSGLNTNLRGPICTRCTRCPLNRDRRKRSLSAHRNPMAAFFCRWGSKHSEIVLASSPRWHRLVALSGAKVRGGGARALRLRLFAVDRNPSHLLLGCR